MLAFVHRMPCREDDSSTAKDLSKVRRRMKHEFAQSPSFYVSCVYMYMFFFSSNSTRASAQGISRLVCGCSPSEHKLISFTL